MPVYKISYTFSNSFDGEEEWNIKRTYSQSWTLGQIYSETIATGDFVYYVVVAGVNPFLAFKKGYYLLLKEVSCVAI